MNLGEALTDVAMTPTRLAAMAILMS